jgi:hypothetical protein
VSAAGAWAERPMGEAQQRLAGRGAGEILAGRARSRPALGRGIGRKGAGPLAGGPGRSRASLSLVVWIRFTGDFRHFFN